jgi:ATP-dependent helicase/nuclease subunit A
LNRAGELLTALARRENADFARCFPHLGEQPVWDAVMATSGSRGRNPTRKSGCPCGRAVRNDAALESILNDAVAFSQREIALMMEPLTAARDALSPEWASVISVLDDDLSRYRALLLHQNYESYRAALRGIEYGVMRFPRGTPDEEKKPVQEVRQAGKDLKKEQEKRFAREKAETLGVLRRSGEAVGALTRIVRRFEQVYAEAKRAANVMDYDDLEHLTLEALRQGPIAAEYREKFRWIAVDEYQDSNRVQEAILSRICRGSNLFFVGDVKQSIYRFRGAEPGLLLEKLSLFSGDQGTRIDISSNFRRFHEVLAAVVTRFWGDFERIVRGYRL